MRAMGGARDHPSVIDFHHRLRRYILVKHASAVFVSIKNTELQFSSDENTIKPTCESFVTMKSRSPHYHYQRVVLDKKK